MVKTSKLAYNVKNYIRSTVQPLKILLRLSPSNNFFGQFLKFVNSANLKTPPPTQNTEISKHLGEHLLFQQHLKRGRMSGLKRQC